MDSQFLSPPFGVGKQFSFAYERPPDTNLTQQPSSLSRNKRTQPKKPVDKTNYIILKQDLPSEQDLQTFIQTTQQNNKTQQEQANYIERSFLKQFVDSSGQNMVLPESIQITLDGIKTLKQSFSEKFPGKDLANCSKDKDLFLKLQHRQPTLLDDQNSIYHGQWCSVSNLPQGLGKCLDKQLSYYEGQFKKGIFQGYGRLITSKKVVFEGFWENGRLNGPGKVTFSPTCYIQGHFRDGVLFGTGQEVKEGILCYSGNFKQGLRHGVGTLYLPQGNVYKGHFCAGMIHGIGCLRFVDGSFMSGSWERGKMNGYGTLKLPDRKVYTGNVEDNMIHGFGVMCYPDGRKLQCEWVYGKPQGHARQVSPDGTVKFLKIDKGRVVKQPAQQNQTQQNNDEQIEQISESNNIANQIAESDDKGDLKQAQISDKMNDEWYYNDSGIELVIKCLQSKVRDVKLFNDLNIALDI